MQTFTNTLTELLSVSAWWRVPVYQRKYEWSIDLASKLFDDILKVGFPPEAAPEDSNKPRFRFTGTIIYVDGARGPSISEKLIVDGQQRLTTVTLIIAALAQHLQRSHGGVLRGEDGKPVIKASELMSTYIYHLAKEDDERYRLLLNGRGGPALKALVDGTSREGMDAPQLFANYDMFCDKIGSLQHLPALFRGLTRLQVSTILLEPTREDPQEVFESFNTQRQELSQGHRIRNFLLMGLPLATQNKLHSTTWEPMEDLLPSDRFERFVRAYIDIHTVEPSTVASVYDVYKDFRRTRPECTNGELTAELYHYAKLYARIALGIEPDAELRAIFDSIVRVKGESAHPFLLKVYRDHEQGVCSLDTLRAVARLTLSYIVRQAVCTNTAKSRRKVLLGIGRKVTEGQDYVASIHRAFAGLTGTSRFPSDDEFKKQLATRDCYTFVHSRYILDTLETFDRKEPVALKSLSIEHILPQGSLSPEWKAALGADWATLHPELRHRLGNLTLTGYNSEMSNKPFLQKRDAADGFLHSPLRLNEGVRECESWGAIEIEERSLSLAGRAAEIWTSPRVSAAAVGAEQHQEQDAGRRPKSKLRVIVGPDDCITGNRASDVMVSAIARMGLKKVYELKEPMAKDALVDYTRSTRYPATCHPCGEFWVQTQGPNDQKKRVLDRVIRRLNLGWTVVVERSDQEEDAPAAPAAKPIVDMFPQTVPLIATAVKERRPRRNATSEADATGHQLPMI